MWRKEPYFSGSLLDIEEVVTNLKINLERSGGIMGSVSSRTIDTNNLTKSQATELMELLTHSDFFNLSSLRSNLSSQNDAADYYICNLILELDYCSL